MCLRALAALNRLFQLRQERVKAVQRLDGSAEAWSLLALMLIKH